jgi:predicted DNA-binding transcriptional regulator YafY
MVAQAKLLRVLKLIGLLKSRSRSITELAKVLDTTQRTVYRYLELLEEVGFIIDKDWHNKYFIHTSEKEQNETLNFSAEESTFLQNLIRGGSGNNPIKDSLLKKLFLHSDLGDVSDELMKARLGKLVNALSEAIKDEKQVILKNYHSAHSGEVRDRLVEPIGFNKTYDTLIAFEVNDLQNKSFKIERIGDIQELKHTFKHQNQHEIPQSDMFGMSSGKIDEVSLRLSLRAYLLMREEYPQAVPYLQKEEDAYYFNGPVRGYSGISRFIVGLMNDVDVIKPESLKKYLNDLLESKKF